MHQMLEGVERDKRRTMERCAHCGINLAKVDPMFLVAEWHVGPPPARRRTLTGRMWCSVQCRDWWIRTQDVRERRAGQAEGTETQRRAACWEGTENTERAVDGKRTEAKERVANEE